MAPARYAIRNVCLEPLNQTSNAVLVNNGVFEAVDTWEQVSNLIDSKTHVYDGANCTMLPGIDDSHLHGYMLGRQLSGVKISPEVCPTLEVLRETLIEFASRSRGWIRGFGWVSGHLRGSGPGGTPSKKDLEGLGINRPIILTDFSGHQAWCNQAALDLALVTLNTSDPDGGAIVRFDSGEPTGLLLEAAVQIVTKVIPKPTSAEKEHALTITSNILLANGITSFTDPGLGPGAASLDDGTASLDVIDTYEKLSSSNALPQRVDVMLLFGGLGGTTTNDVICGLSEFGIPKVRSAQNKISVSQLKVFADGIPRSRTAWMSEPYDNNKHGSLTISGTNDKERLNTLESIYKVATEMGWQVGIHATGDQTVSSIIDVAERYPDTRKLRNYIIHADLIKPQDYKRISNAGLGLNMQPTIRWMVGRNVEGILGSRRFSRRLQLKQAHDAGINIALSSDAPVSPPDWRMTLATSIDRSFNGDTSYQDDQGFTARTALLAMTLGAAHQSHSETWRGAIARGFVADFLLLDKKIKFDGDPWEILKSRATAVAIGGAIEFGEL